MYFHSEALCVAFPDISRGCRETLTAKMPVSFRISLLSLPPLGDLVPTEVSRATVSMKLLGVHHVPHTAKPDLQQSLALNEVLLRAVYACPSPGFSAPNLVTVRHKEAVTQPL